MTEKEYNQCVDLYADGVYRFILKNLSHEEDARDIVQNSFEALWRHHRELAPEKARAWLFTAAYRSMIDHIRKTRRVTLVDSFQENAGLREEQPRQLQGVLQQALRQLSEIQRSLVMLKDYEGYSYEEIGGITGLNPSQVKVYLHRARLKMKAFLVRRENVI